MNKRTLIYLALGISLLTGLPGVTGQDQDDPTLLLDLGRPSVRGRTLDISPGTIYSVRPHDPGPGLLPLCVHR